jgi:hypothetical protein
MVQCRAAGTLDTQVLQELERGPGSERRTALGILALNERPSRGADQEERASIEIYDPYAQVFAKDSPVMAGDDLAGFGFIGSATGRGMMHRGLSGTVSRPKMQGHSSGRPGSFLLGSIL